MIQRIQTIFLFIAIVALGLMAYFPIADFYSNTAIYSLNVIELESLTPDAPIPFPEWFFTPITATVALIIILDIIALFSFKKRKRQINLTQVTIFLNVVLIVGTLFFYINEVEDITKSQVDYQGAFGIYLPLISLVFNVLAQRFIRKDEALVRSADRLR